MLSASATRLGRRRKPGRSVLMAAVMATVAATAAATTKIGPTCQMPTTANYCSQHDPPAGDGSGSAQAADPNIVLDLLDGFRKSAVLHAALGVCEALAAVDGGSGLTAAEVADRVGASLDGTQRLLHAMTAIGLCTHDAGADTFANSPTASAFLTRGSDAPDLSGYVRHSARVLYPLWGALPAAVVDGSHQWHSAFAHLGGADADPTFEDVFGHLYPSEAAVNQFVDAMDSFAALSAPPVLGAFDLSGFRTMVDLGGGSGAFVRAALSVYPELTCTLADLPPVVASTRQRLSDLAGPRLDFAEVDFFGSDEDADAPSLPRGDLYVLSRILHDWSDSACVDILRRVRAALSEDGAVLVADMVMDATKDGPPRATLQSLNMLAQTDGKERTAAEFEALFRAAGFQGSVEAVSTGSYLDAVLARKAEA